MNILVVDDHPDTADAIAMLLGMRGHRVRAAYAGLDAMALAVELQPELAFVDLELPDVSGVEVARALRSHAAGRVKLIALSGRRLRESEHGFDMHLLKPVIARELYACCDGALLAMRSGRLCFTSS